MQRFKRRCPVVLLFLLLVVFLPRVTGLSSFRSGPQSWRPPNDTIVAADGTRTTPRAEVRLGTPEDFTALATLLQSCGMQEASKGQITMALEDEMFLLIPESSEGRGGEEEEDVEEEEACEALLGAVCFEAIFDGNSPCDRMAYVSHLGVARAARRQGLARRLLAEAGERAYELGCSGKACLLVDRNNRAAIAFYSSLPGFTVVGHTEGGGWKDSPPAARAQRREQESWLKRNIGGGSGALPPQPMQQQQQQQQQMMAPPRDVDSLVLVTGGLWPLPQGFLL